MPTARRCTLCGGPLELDRSAERLAHEAQLRESFVDDRLGHRPEELEAMDLTRFMHGEPARLLVCRHCGLLIRDEPATADYASDRYDSTLLRHLYPRYLRAFEDKRSRYEPLLRPGAEVLELGSHLGAFLEAAEDWGWRPTGLDIGAATSTFARKSGGLVRRMTLDDYSPLYRNPEAIFIWNCFEQLEDPHATLARAYRLLDRHGLIVVRVPNGEFYREQRRALERAHSPAVLRQLGYNNLLAFPYLYGYSAGPLGNLLRTSGFEPIAAYGADLLTPPYPDMTKRVRREWQEAHRESLGKRVGSWIEMVARRTSVPAKRE